MISRIIALGALLLLPLADYDPACYLKCQAEACREACTPERIRERPEDCKACGEAYDRVCREQCPGKKPVSRGER